MKKQLFPSKYASITIDIEDWFHVESLNEHIPPSVWDLQESRVEMNTDRLLSLLRSLKVKATFFVLGWVADRYPELIKRIHREDHEIASHGYSHKLNYKMTRDELYEDLEHSKLLLEKIIGEPVTGYRAPTFSIDDRVVAALQKVGYHYDSSFNPFTLHDRYGTLIHTPLTHNRRQIIHSLDGGFSEVSLPAVTLMNKEIPIAGGGFFRLYPLSLSKWLLKIFYRQNDYYIFYTHPWEIDADQPYLKNLEWSNRFRHYLNLKHNHDKIKNYILYMRANGTTFIPVNAYLKLKGY